MWRKEEEHLVLAGAVEIIASSNIIHAEGAAEIVTSSKIIYAGGRQANAVGKEDAADGAELCGVLA
jgi:hypothetical protein